MPFAPLLAHPGARPPIQLDVMALDANWPLGLFVVGGAPAPDNQAFTLQLGILNEASETVSVAAGSQYKEALSVYRNGRWLGLIYVGAVTSSGRNLLPVAGQGTAALPPGVWDQVRFQFAPPDDDPVAAIRFSASGLTAMTTYPLPQVSSKPVGQPWALPGAAATPEPNIR
jgi:hypothetical protein